MDSFIKYLLASSTCVFLGQAVPASAQIVDVLAESNAELEPGFSGSGDVSWEERQDSSSYSIFTLSSQNFFRADNQVLMLLLLREYGEQNDERFIDSSFAHLRYRYQWTNDWEWEAFLQYDRNPFRRLSSR